MQLRILLLSAIASFFLQRVREREREKEAGRSGKLG